MLQGSGGAQEREDIRAISLKIEQSKRVLFAALAKDRQSYIADTDAGSGFG